MPIPYDTRETNSLLQNKNMTDWKIERRGQKYALRGIYGSEPYWPQEKWRFASRAPAGLSVRLIMSSVSYTTRDDEKGAAPVIGDDSISRDVFFFSSLFFSLSHSLVVGFEEIERVWRAQSLCFFVFRKHFARVCVNTGRRRERRKSDPPKLSHCWGNSAAVVAPQIHL